MDRRPTPSARLAPVAVALAALLVLAGCAGPASPGASAGTGSDTATGAGTAGDAAGTGGTPTATPHPAAGPTVRATVVEVVDGDTVKVRFPNGSRDTVRLLGVDTPEVHSANTPDEFEGVPETTAGRECLRRAGEEASAVAERRLAGREVGLGFDPRAGRRGYYDRLLAYVYVDGRQFNHRLLVEGHARVYESPFVERERYRATEERARAAGRGLWTCASPDATAAGTTRRESGSAGATGLVVAAVHADAEGADGENLVDEYVVLRNDGDDPIDLSGWTVTDAAGKTYRFPDGTTLEAGARLVLHTGAGTDGTTDVYWDYGSPVWNNDGDTVTVRTDDGTVVVEYTYG